MERKGMNYMSKENNNAQEQQEEMYQSILGDEVPIDDAETSEAEQAAPAKPKASKKKILTIVGVSAASAALVGCLTFAGIGIYKKNLTENVAVTPNYSFDSKVAACYFRDVIDIFVESYGEEAMLTYYGMDVNKSLKEQVYPYDETATWFDVVVDQTMSTMKQQLIIYEAANAAGYQLTDADRERIEAAIAEKDLADYGNGVTEEDLRRTLEIQAISTSYYTQLVNSFEATDEEINAYYDENSLSFMKCGLAGFSVSYDSGESTGEEGMTQDEAKKLAEDLADSSNPKVFEDKVADILLNYEGYTEDELEVNLPAIYNDSYAYSAGNELAEWAFGGAKKNDTYIIEGSGIYYVYILTDEPSRDESTTVNVRHILYMNADDNMAAAKDVLAEWESGDKTEESFAALAEQYSEDGGSNTNGGLYTGVYQGQMVQAFNDWCFDKSRKVGDTGIVETEYGVHVMYFSGDSGPAWKSNIAATLSQKAYDDWLQEQTALYPVTFDEEALNRIEG